MQGWYFLHPHIEWPSDPRRARLWAALLSEHWMTADEMLAVCAARGE